MVEPLRHRQTKGAETDMPGLLPPRHIPTLPDCAVWAAVGQWQERGIFAHTLRRQPPAAERRKQPFENRLIVLVLGEPFGDHRLRD